MKHITVLKKETVDLLDVKDGGIYLDLTFGSGGHTEEILNRGKNIGVIAFDLDKRNINEFSSEFIITKSKWGEGNFELLDKGEFDHLKESRVLVVNENFANLDRILKAAGVDKVDGIIADLGWSSDQLDHIQGLSYELKDEVLDMRFHQNLGVTAADLLNGLGQRELGEMFKQYADIFGAENSRLVDEIKSYRRKKFFETVTDILKVIDQVYNFNKFNRQDKSRRYQMYGRIFQALRIAVNQEYSNLKEMLEKGFTSLRKGGVMSIITFHSGEEKIVKEFINRKKFLEIISKSSQGEYIRPGIEELSENLRARSAKLYGLKRI